MGTGESGIGLAMRSDGVGAAFDERVGHCLVALRGCAAEGDRERRGKCDTRERHGEDEDQRNRRSPLRGLLHSGPSHSARMAVQAHRENVPAVTVQIRDPEGMSFPGSDQHEREKERFHGPACQAG